jgi:uncharacterized membrane-anchored protein
MCYESSVVVRGATWRRAPAPCRLPVIALLVVGAAAAVWPAEAGAAAPDLLPAEAGAAAAGGAADAPGMTASGTAADGAMAGGLPPGAALPQAADPATAFLASLSPQRGSVVLPAAGARLELPESLYFLSAADARRVLEEAWGNPPDEGVLGMLFPSGFTPLDEAAWGVVVTYVEDGWVDDGDAAGIDYDALLDEMRADTAAANDARAEAGFPTVELVGWAAPPHYDAAGHKLHWAKELKFGGTGENTLNYAIRVLGRRGVLELNFVASMSQLPAITERLPEVLAAATFADGAAYDDFDPDLDTVAGYGIGALVAGKVAAKFGLFAAAALFLKKFGAIAIAGVAAGIAWLRKRAARTRDA